MESYVKEYSYPNGEIQRVQIVTLDDWSQLNFWKPAPSEHMLNCVADIYERYLVPACPWIFGNMVLFRLPEDVEVPFSWETEYGTVGDDLAAASAAMRGGVKVSKGKPIFSDPQVEAFWKKLEERNCIRIVRGKLPVTTIIPVSNQAGYMTAAEKGAKLKVNASFFIMDRFDCATVYDQVSTPFGLRVKDGVVESPPLFGREALLVRDEGVCVEPVDVRDLELVIGGKAYKHGRNCTIYSRPERRRTPGSKGTKLVIIGCRVAAVSNARHVDIPASGFVLCLPDICDMQPGAQVIFRGLEDVWFGIQVGNSIIRNGEKTMHFISRFYNIRKLQPIPFPPSLYPMDFVNSRAARIALGANEEGKPMLLWAEGASKGIYIPGHDSAGATLAQMADICAEAGMVHAVNLDGGGSAQILLSNRRSLRISDRNPDDTEAERPVPMGLIVK